MKLTCPTIALIFSALLTAAGAVHCQETYPVLRQALVYAEPDAGSVVLDVLVVGMRVEVTERQDGWTRVQVPGSAEVGWIQSDRLGEVNAATIPAPARSGVVPAGMDEAQMSVLRNRVSAMNGSLDRIEGNLDLLVDRLQGPQETVRSELPVTPEPPSVSSPAESSAAKVAVQGASKFRWTNRFLMGKYFRGGEDLYGLAISRSLENSGRLVLELETLYGMGDDRGQADDFIEWGLGLRYNIKNRSYWIYPFLEGAFGMRYRVGDVADGSGPLHYRVFSPGGGVKAELGDIFALEAASRAVYLFGTGSRRSEGRITFSVLFSY